MPDVDLRLLGSPPAVVDGVPTALPAHVPASLLAYLAVARDWVPRSELANATNGVLVGGSASATLERNTIAGAAAGVRLESQGTAQGAENTFADVGVDVDDAR